MSQPKSIVVYPYHYLHIKDLTEQRFRLLEGPCLFIRQENEQIVGSVKPMKMIELANRQFCEIMNPVQRDENNVVIINEKTGQPNNIVGGHEIRFQEDYPEPFPLYYGENLHKKPTTMYALKDNQSCRIRCNRDHDKIHAGDEWMIHGPCTYKHRVEDDMIEVLTAKVNVAGNALKLRALRPFKDQTGVQRLAGQEWLMTKPGIYKLEAEEQFVQTIKPFVITKKQALHLYAERNFKDAYGVKRQAGDEWLVTRELSSTHLLSINETKVGFSQLYILNKDQYCVILDPVNKETLSNQLGAKDLRMGPKEFFLLPGENLEDGCIKDIMILSKDEALLCQATQDFKNGDSKHTSGEKWTVRGPCRYQPDVRVDVLEKRQTVSLDKNEGVYIRDIRSGEVKLVSNQAYMLQSHEEFHKLALDSLTNKLLTRANGCKRNDLTSAISYQIPYNEACQIYNFKSNTNRIVFGPSQVMLQPEEQFTVMTLSGKTPKQPNQLSVLSLRLGPTYSKDLIEVETSDHARLKIQLSYNWKFGVDQNDQNDCQKIFHSRDFIGDMCMFLAARVRAAVAQNSFEAFHERNSTIIRKAIMGVEQNGKIRDVYLFTNSGLQILNVDIQLVEPVQESTKNKLKQSVTQAIKIHTQSIEAEFLAEQKIVEQQNKGMLEEQKIADDQRAETIRGLNQQLKAESTMIINKGKAIAKAQAQMEAKKIVLESRVRQAQFESEAEEIMSNSKLENEQSLILQGLQHEQKMQQLNLDKKKQVAEIEGGKFKRMMDVIGQETMVSMAEAGPKQQAELLGALGLTGFIMTDGNNPINLFNTANGLVGGNMEGEDLM